MKYQVLFSLKNNEKIFKIVACCVVLGALGVKYSFLIDSVTSTVKK